MSSVSLVLLSDYSAIGDTSECDAPYSDSPPVRPVFAIGYLYGKKWCSSDRLRYHKKHRVAGDLRQMSRDRGGYFGWVTKSPVVILRNCQKESGKRSLAKK